MRKKLLLAFASAFVFQLGFFSCEDGGGFIIDQARHPAGYTGETGQTQPDLRY